MFINDGAAGRVSANTAFHNDLPNFVNGPYHAPKFSSTPFSSHDDFPIVVSSEDIPAMVPVEEEGTE